MLHEKENTIQRGNHIKPITGYTEFLLGKLCVVRYDDILYTGNIIDVEESDVIVSCMHKCGKNSF